MNELERKIDILLKDTSRSFYLTLNVLPKKMRKQIGLTYLLARISDTIADSRVGDPKNLSYFISRYNDRIQNITKEIPDLTDLSALQENLAEKELLKNINIPIDYLEKSNSISDSDRMKIRQCLEIIIKGQKLDLERFGMPTKENIIALKSEKELDDYTYSVAGSVGEFWTHMTIDHQFVTNEKLRKKLFEKGIKFGKALQLINILRDIPEDILIGRCYIPEDELLRYNLIPDDLLDMKKMNEFRPLYDSYISKTYGYLKDAIDYVSLLPNNEYRLRLSCLLPILIGQRTLRMLTENNVLDGENRIKVSRKDIKKIFRRALFASLSKNKSLNLLKKNMI
ncbi:MAG: farnesyl-diphosphate farnesyltransferase [Euryarchaeota archaeon]|nr:farnesyl-diphosphate farnesyltransferase [Euryarchaeota archaeon]OUV26271.1 MAG: hypothetical protein CBC57_02650 [Euryarchaeota archaeon TMED97]